MQTHIPHVDRCLLWWRLCVSSLPHSQASYSILHLSPNCSRSLNQRHYAIHDVSPSVTKSLLDLLPSHTHCTGVPQILPHPPILRRRGPVRQPDSNSRIPRHQRTSRQRPRQLQHHQRASCHRPHPPPTTHPPLHNRHLLPHRLLHRRLLIHLPQIRHRRHGPQPILLPPHLLLQLLHRLHTEIHHPHHKRHLGRQRRRPLHENRSSARNLPQSKRLLPNRPRSQLQHTGYSSGRDALGVLLAS